jgi:hypothetical protein
VQLLSVDDVVPSFTRHDLDRRRTTVQARASTPRKIGRQREDVGRRHDHDAGGDAAVRAAKAARREEIWASLAMPGISRFPRPGGRIPNFVGAEAAAELLRGLQEWQAATTIKANPDSPQLPVRQRAHVARSGNMGGC